ncbi:Hypothetical protein GLP15_4804 [Giardia lamblia P15]|uniref:Leucine-rich repeat protein n=1 Tax=Giardia intestinalis (strain P15) TaxID=658858 RepID=E1F9Q5_GIAIA|nr:Hypothetical protein GLP15_4804 [Giardia lamblia P15]
MFNYTVYERPITLAIFKECVGVGGDDIIPVLMELERANMQGKGLTSLDGLDMCSQLKCADLSHNLISSIDPLILEIIPTLETLNLSHNKLTNSLDLSCLPKHHKLRHLNIAFNPIKALDVSRLPCSLEVLCVSEGQLITIDKDAIKNQCPNIKEVILIEGEGHEGVKVVNAIAEKIEKNAVLDTSVAADTVRFDSDHNIIVPSTKQKVSAVAVTAKAPLSGSRGPPSRSLSGVSKTGTRQKTVAPAVGSSSNKPKSVPATNQVAARAGSQKTMEATPTVLDNTVSTKEKAVQEVLDGLEAKLNTALDVVDSMDREFLQIEKLVEDTLENSRKRELDLFEALGKTK